MICTQYFITYCFVYDILYEKIIEKKEKKGDRTTASNHQFIDRLGSEERKGSEAHRRKDGEEFRTARTQIRRIIDIPMRDRFFPTS